MTTITQSINDFMAKYSIRLSSCEYADENKNAPDWKDANHYRVTLKCGKRRLTTYFSQGYGIQGEPKADSILDCLASDAAGFINAYSFEEWCSEYDYDTDSRKAERIYRVIGKQKDQLQKWLGSYSILQELCFETERT